MKLIAAMEIKGNGRTEGNTEHGWQSLLQVAPRALGDPRMFSKLAIVEVLGKKHADSSPHWKWERAKDDTVSSLVTHCKKASARQRAVSPTCSPPPGPPGFSPVPPFPHSPEKSGSGQGFEAGSGGTPGSGFGSSAGLTSVHHRCKTQEDKTGCSLPRF